MKLAAIDEVLAVAIVDVGIRGVVERSRVRTAEDPQQAASSGRCK